MAKQARIQVEIPRRFRKLFPQVQRNFKTLNRFTQEVVRHLLTMQSAEDELNLKLTRQLFGKMCCLKFIEMGPCDQFKIEKQQLLRFVDAHMKSLAPSAPAKSESSGPTAESPQITRAKEGRWDLSHSNQIKLAPQNPGRRSPGPAPFGRRLDSGFGPKKMGPEASNTRREFEGSGVEPKYLEHWVWLAANFGMGSIEAQSFRKLIADSYASAENAELGWEIHK